ncbi:scarecrow-like protein 14 [Panicum virgatum]|uniref:Scarecrow-like protein 9 n=1 Tax=Panicum virgatum TaxID=38727 RepID=A0A8T0PRE8_PANVG|nr:scarecrow-like protein 14 [Panicum virgatum]KAG2564260.1 hypothetical protein PVAP13_8KG243300 [Panicum virgatum]
MAAAPEPFSPSVFLDLPPTPPRPDVDGEDPAALPDDLVLPYISRMLMEEDMDDDEFLYQYPDHPALLQAQESYAQILSDAAATNTNGSSGTFTLSPSSSHLPVLANATWPYDPLELTQLLAAGGATANAVCLPRSGEASQSRVDMDMLNQAFLKGMEEANKLLPTSNSLFISMENHVTATGQVKKKNKNGAVDGMLLFQGSGNGRGRKNSRREGDDLEGRSSKLMVPEPEETGEMVDKMVFDGYMMCLDNMKSMRITMAGGTKANGSADGAVDLSTLLLHCAQAVSMDDHGSAAQLLRRIKQHSSPRGDANQRLAYCFAEGLEARLAGTGSQLHRSLVAKRTSAVEFLRAYQLYLAVSCFKMTAYRFSNMTISKAIARKKKLHIVDYGVQYGCQWPSLLDFLAKTKDGLPEVRMTCIGLPEPGFRPAARIEETGRRLSNFATQCGLPFKFQSIAAKWETICARDLRVEPDEVLVVNCITHFQNLMDEGADICSPSPRDVVLKNIQEMQPDVFILAVVNGSYNAPFFITRFREALFYYSAMFDMLDATAPRDSEQRLVVERDLVGRCALNVISCEGSDRVERPETYRQWQLRNRQAGLRQLPLYPDIVKVLSDKVRDQYHKDFVIDVDHQWLLQGWKGRILYAMSTWAADDAVNLQSEL